MDYRIKDAKYIRDYIIWIKFHDGLSGEIDLKDEIYGPIFEPLKDLEYFKSFTVHPELKSLTWKNGADFSPEYLYESIREAA